MTLKLKTPQELQEMTALERQIYRTQVWLQFREEWGKAQVQAWAPILRAVERSNESKAALVMREGSRVAAIITIEFFQGGSLEDALVRLSVDRRDGSPTEEYAPHPDEVMAYLRCLGIDPYGRALNWEPV